MILVWLRRDLRALDNTALATAFRTGEPVVACFVATPDQWQSHHMSPMQADLIAERLGHLNQDLQKLNVPLLYAEVSDFEASTNKVVGWAKELGAHHVYVNQEYEVNEQERDALAEELLASNHIGFERFHDKCIQAPKSVLNKQGSYFKVFTPFKRAWLAQFQMPHIEKLNPQQAFEHPLESELYGVSSSFSYPRESSKAWPADTVSILNNLREFVRERSSAYKADRDFPSIDGTSQLSPYLAIGALSPRQCVARLFAEADQYGLREGQDIWLSEIIWREFYQHLIVFEPKLVKHKGFIDWEDRIEWGSGEDWLEKWKQGRTGYPIVDAAMRQLNDTGWMHNRLRMVVASFLVKDLHLDWRLGEQYFMSKLVDGDFAANNGGWQWCASTGCDGQPYFRIFNPISQGERFDVKGDFVRHWIPELNVIPDKFLHKPWMWSEFGGIDYPPPMVDHKQEREITLARYKTAKG